MGKSERLVSLDIFRGVTIAAMILVNNPGTWSSIYPPLRHAEWHGCTPTDLIFPFFLFIVGVAITLSLTKRKERGDDQMKLIGKILYRGAVIFALGLLLTLIPNFDFSTVRIPGVLQRIAVVYVIASILFLKTSVRTQIYFGAGFLILYWILMSFIPVPGVGYANLEPTTNLAAYIDNLLLGGHLWSYTKVWDPEGILSTIPAISTAISGIMLGHWLGTNNDRTTKTAWMFIFGTASVLLGLIWNYHFPINKSIWTSSYVLYTSGLATIAFAWVYFIVDVQKYTWWTKPFVVYGMNAITVFWFSGLVAKILYLVKVTGADGQEISLKGLIFNNVYLSWLDPINASLAYALTYVLIWLGLMWILYAKKIFIKV